MKHDPVFTAACILFCVILGTAGFWLFTYGKREATKRVQQQQNSPTFGPFDDANADLLGVPRKNTKNFRIPGK